MVPSCLIWCLWRERNDRNFEDKERTFEEFRTLFFYSLYTWTAAFLAPLVITFLDFLVLFSFSVLDAPLVYSLCT
jgi:hypothetical protein